jgi:hypothetical protein
MLSPVVANTCGLITHLSPSITTLKRPSFSRALGRPALHVLMALGFAAAFVWPMFAFTQPDQTVRFTYLAWMLSWATLFLISRGKGDAVDPNVVHDSMPPSSASGRREER